MINKVHKSIMCSSNIIAIYLCTKLMIFLAMSHRLCTNINRTLRSIGAFVRDESKLVPVVLSRVQYSDIAPTVRSKS